MARTPQVTRTIQTTKAVVLCLNLETQEAEKQEFTLPRTYKDDKAIIKQLEVQMDTTKVKPVHVDSTTVNETLYGMSEQKFIELAEILPPRAKADESTETTADENTDNK